MEIPEDSSACAALIEVAPEWTLAATDRTRSPSLLYALSAATLLPLLVFPLVWSVALANQAVFPGLGLLLVITGPMHVASTAFFYADRAFRPVLGEAPFRCFWALVLLPLGVAGLGVLGIATAGPWTLLAICVLQNVWLFHHYQRQNFGLISLVSLHIGCGRLPARVNTALNLAALGGLISLVGIPEFISGLDTLGVSTKGLIAPQVSVALRYLGASVYGMSLLMMAGIIFSERALRRNAWLLGSLVVGMAFFLPTVTFASVPMAFFPPAIAHGAQYILMMSIVSRRSARGWVGFATMCAIGGIAGYGLDLLKGWPWILVGTGLVQVHFLIDAKVWRLREQRQRAIVDERFDFFLPA